MRYPDTIKYSAAVLIIALLFVGVAGPLGIGPSMWGHSEGCFASIETPCPMELFASAIHHVSAFTALASVPLFLALTLLLLFALVFYAKFLEIPRLSPASAPLWRAIDYSFGTPRALLRALARLEHSPPAVSNGLLFV